MEGYIGEIRMFAGNFAPGAWNFCDGSLQSIAVYTALFSIIGTTYGGDGQTTFALPDFVGQAPIGTGQGAGLSKYELGETAGSETVTMTTAQMPMHTHNTAIAVSVPAYSETGSTASPNNAILANRTGAYTLEQADSSISPFNSAVTLAPVGNNMPFNITSPFLVLNYIICMEGIYPSRN